MLASAFRKDLACFGERKLVDSAEATRALRQRRYETLFCVWLVNRRRKEVGTRVND